MSSESSHGIRIRATAANPQVHFCVTNSSVVNWTYGVFGSGWLEGIYITNGEVWQCRHPVYIDRSGAGAKAGTFAFTNVHMNSWSDCITVIYATTILVNNCEIYHGSAPAAGTLAANLIKLATCDNIEISGNHLSSAYNAVSVNGAVLDGCQHGTVSGNLFRRIVGTAMWMVNGTNRIGTTGNTFTGADITMAAALTIDATCAKNHAKANVIAENVTSAFVNASTTCSWGSRGARVYTTSAQSIASGSNIKFFWDAATYDHAGFFDNGNDRLTVPAGVSRVRVGAQVLFASTGTNYRHGLAITKNGSNTWAGVPYLTVSGDGPCLNVWSDAVDVTPGDYFEVIIAQASGGSITAGGTAVTWFAVEAIE